jgi:hypothetical protein
VYGIWILYILYMDPICIPGRTCGSSKRTSFPARAATCCHARAGPAFEGGDWGKPWAAHVLPLTGGPPPEIGTVPRPRCEPAPALLAQCADALSPRTCKLAGCTPKAAALPLSAKRQAAAPKRRKGPESKGLKAPPRKRRAASGPAAGGAGGALEEPRRPAPARKRRRVPGRAGPASRGGDWGEPWDCSEGEFSEHPTEDDGGGSPPKEQEEPEEWPEERKLSRWAKK